MKMKQFYKCCTGVIMLETILVLPVYIVLLFGVFWLGESCLARFVLINGENLRLWENSSQHSLTQIPERDIFWEFPAIGDVTAVSGTGSFNFFQAADVNNTRWGQMVVGRATGILRRSALSHGAVSSAKYMWGISPSANANMLMAARGTVENPLNSHLLSRRNYAGRSDIYSSLSRGDGVLWETEYISPWRLPSDDDNSTNFDVVPVSGDVVLKPGESISSIGPYNGGSRNDNYVNWSI